MHLKRQKIPKNWPIKRKGTKYLVRPNSNLTKGIPILIILRDMLKVAQNRREVKRIIHSKQLLLNNKFVKDDKACAVLFDTLEIVPSKKFYKISLAKTGKFTTEEIKKEESNHKISKIVNKKILKGKKIQINLSDGRNFISNVKCKINDSLLTNKNHTNCSILIVNFYILKYGYHQHFPSTKSETLVHAKRKKYWNLDTSKY